MNCSWNKLAALAASIALHVALVACIEAPIDAGRVKALLREPETTPLHAVLGEGRATQISRGIEKIGIDQLPSAAMAPERSLLPGLHYYRTRELDVVPGIMTQAEPAYPERAARRFLAGKVILRLFIDEYGKVERVVTVRADPPGYFEQPAEDAFRGARFSAGMKGGKPVRTQITLEVNFEHPAAPGS